MEPGEPRLHVDGGDPSHRHRAEAGDDVPAQEVAVEVDGRGLQLRRLRHQPPVGPLTERDVAEARVVPHASGHVRLGGRQPPLPVALGGEGVGCDDAIPRGVPVAGLPPSRRKAADRSESAACRHGGLRMVGVFEADSTARPSRANQIVRRWWDVQPGPSAVERSRLQRSEEGGALFLTEIVDHHLLVGRERPSATQQLLDGKLQAVPMVRSDGSGRHLAINCTERRRRRSPWATLVEGRWPDAQAGRPGCRRYSSIHSRISAGSKRIR